MASEAQINLIELEQQLPSVDRQIAPGATIEEVRELITNFKQDPSVPSRNNVLQDLIDKDEDEDFEGMQTSLPEEENYGQESPDGDMSDIIQKTIKNDVLIATQPDANSPQTQDQEHIQTEQCETPVQGNLLEIKEEKREEEEEEKKKTPEGSPKLELSEEIKMKPEEAAAEETVIAKEEEIQNMDGPPALADEEVQQEPPVAPQPPQLPQTPQEPQAPQTPQAPQPLQDTTAPMEDLGAPAASVEDAPAQGSKGDGLEGVGPLEREQLILIRETLALMGYAKAGYSITKLLEKLGTSRLRFGTGKNSQFSRIRELCERFPGAIAVSDLGGRMRIGLHEWVADNVSICPVCHTSGMEGAWIQCSLEDCGRWVHEVCDCVQHEDASRDDFAYICPICRRAGKGPDVSCFVSACDCVRDLLIRLRFTDEKAYSSSLERALKDATRALDAGGNEGNEFNKGIFLVAKRLLEAFGEAAPLFTETPERKRAPVAAVEQHPIVSEDIGTGSAGN